MTSPRNSPVSLRDLDRSAIALPDLPAFDADLSAYYTILNGRPDLRLVNACIHQLEENQELVKKERDYADAQSIWLQNQGVWALTVGIASLFSLVNSVYTLHLSHASTIWVWLAGFAAGLIALIDIALILVFLRGSRGSRVRPDTLTKTAEELGGLLASFRILRDQLEDAATKEAAGHHSPRRSRFGRPR